METGTRSTSSWMIAHRLNSESETENVSMYLCIKVKIFDVHIKNGYEYCELVQ